MFEADNAPKKGVIAFITNRTFLAGKPYAGLRKMLRERFDRIEVIDLRGDLRRGARAGVRGDTGVFNIQVGTAITLAIADGSKTQGELADVAYNDVWEHELFAREAKLEWLEQGASIGARSGFVQIRRGVLEDFKPVPFQQQQWPSLGACFGFGSSGLESKRDDVVYDVTRGGLIEKLKRFLSASFEERSRTFNPTDLNPVPDPNVGADPNLIRRAAYRPLDVRFHYAHPKWNDRPRPELGRVWGPNNVAIFALPSSTSTGPGVWCHSEYPDRHAFRGSYGGYAFPLFDRRPGYDPSNVSPALLAGLELAYHASVDSEAAFDAILALLSASSYTLRFAEDLEDVFPHVPFPAKRALFDEAAAIGKQIREVEAFARPPDPKFLTAQIARVETPPHGPLADIGPGSWDEGELILCENGSGRISGIPAAVWQFSVSGYPVLPRWLAARKGIEVTHDFLNEFRDITGRINELIHLFAEADIVLQKAVNHSLTRERLGLESAPAEDENERP